jgi:NitT/TauT family transport system substrate-binding protein
VPASGREDFSTINRTFRSGAAAGIVLAAALLAGCSKSPPAAAAGPALTPVVLQGNWYAETEYGGYYEALAKGYYKDEGLDLTIVQGGPGAYPVQRVAAGAAQFAMARSDDLMMAAQQGIPVLIVAAQLEHDPQVIIVHAESAVHGFADLGGKSIMVEPGSAWITYLEQKYAIHIHTIPENYGIAQFLADKAFIQQGFLTAEPFQFEQLKVPCRVMLIADSGYDPYRALFCSRPYAEAHPAVVKAFIRASIRGWQDYLRGDPAVADALITQAHADSTAELLAYGRAHLLASHIVDGRAEAGEAVGLVTRHRLEAQVAILRRLGMLTRDLDVDQVASFDYLPADLQDRARK